MWEAIYGFIRFRWPDDDDFVLKKGDIRIQVQNAQIQPDKSIIGTVQSVEPYQALASIGVDENTVIKFSAPRASVSVLTDSVWLHLGRE